MPHSTFRQAPSHRGLASDVLGFPLFPRQAEVVDEIYRGNVRTAVLRLGRRSGKGRIAAVVAACEAVVNGQDHPSAVPVGEQVVIAVVATSRDQDRMVHGCIRGFLERPALHAQVARESARRMDDYIAAGNR